MKATTKTSRVNTALQVIQHMNDGISVVAACKELGIPRSTFYDIVKKNPDAVRKYQNLSANRHSYFYFTCNSLAYWVDTIETMLSTHNFTPKIRQLSTP